MQTAATLPINFINYFAIKIAVNVSFNNQKAGRESTRAFCLHEFSLSAAMWIMISKSITLTFGLDKERERDQKKI